MLTLSDPDRRAIEAHAARGYPEEVCGFLIGHDRTVSRVLAAENAVADAASRRNRFSLSPDRVYEADRDARRTGESLIGVYHSHPDHPARPSPTDREWAWPGYVYIIVAVADGRIADFTAWTLPDEPDSDFVPERIAVRAADR